MEDELLRVNPMSKIAAPRTEQRLMEALTTSEIDRVLRTARQGRGFAGIRDTAILATLIGTGLRREELCELTDQNVRLTEAFMLVDGKGGKQRLVPLPAKLRQMMIRYRYAWRDDRRRSPMRSILP
jgi:integrase/recombinase XerD